MKQMRGVQLLATLAAVAAASSSSNILGIGVYNDTQGSPGVNLQLPVAANLTGSGGWVLLFFENIDLPTNNLLPEAWQIAALQQAWALGLKPIVRLGQWRRNYRNYSDDAQHLSYKALAQVYANYVAALPGPPSPSSEPLRLILLNEPNICSEWECAEEGPTVYLPSATIAAEVAALSRDVLAAITALPGSYRIAVPPIASVGFPQCQCVPGGSGNNGPQNVNATAFIGQMMAAVTGVYANATDFSAHPYPACQEPFTSWCAAGWLAEYQQQYAVAMPSWQSNPAHSAPGARWPIWISETGWQSPQNETDKAVWMVQALTQLWGADPAVDAVLPFLLAGPQWTPQGWPWTLWNNDSTAVVTYQPQYSAVRALGAAAADTEARVQAQAQAQALPWLPSLLPASPLSQQAYYNSTFASWGGSVIEVPEDPTWRYHMYVAAFINRCGLNAWEVNSEVIHTVSNNPLGPFTMLDVALPVWHHNPQVTRYVDGTFLLYSIGMNPEGRVANCTKEQQQHHHQQQQGVALGPLQHGAELIQVHTSSTPYGPWTPVQPGAFNLFNGTNPSPWVLPNGTVVVASHDNGGLSISTAPHWSGPYTPARDVLPYDSSKNWTFEDPFLWYSCAADNVTDCKWRVLLHQYQTNDTHHQFAVGGYAETAGPDVFGPWTLQSESTPVYTVAVSFSDGSNVTYSRRERPKVLMGPPPLSQPLVLYTGVCPQNSDACYTLSQPFANGTTTRQA